MRLLPRVLLPALLLLGIAAFGFFSCLLLRLFLRSARGFFPLTARLFGGTAALFLGGALSPDELIERYDAVTREDVLALARRCLAPETMSFSAAGRVSAAEDYRRLLGMPE